MSSPRGPLSIPEKENGDVPVEAHAIGGLAGWQMRTLSQLAATQLADLTVGSLAAAANLSPFHFSRAFRRTFGISPREWLVREKLVRARTLLRTTSDSVDKIAVSLGYKSGSQLARPFRARFGISPQAYRRA